MYFVVVAQSLRTVCEGDAEVERLGAVLGACDRLLHVAEEYASGCKHLDVDKSENFAGLYMGCHLSAMARTVVVAIYRIVGLGDTRHLSHDVAGAPGRTAEVDVWVVARERSVGSYLVEGLGLSAYNSRLVYLTCHPSIEIAILERYELALCH